MSRSIDQRVVEMQFDNRNFEQNVSTTMSSLDKLKQKLNLDGASKGLENIGSAAKKFDMSGMDRAVDTVTRRFSALEVMGVTALANITNSAVNAGKRMVAALTIDPVKTGFNEYELKIDSVRTIMASTGESIQTVNGYLGELNTYADKTIYSFADMTQNIGKFTNAGVKLNDAVLAIKGISNEAAVSGANANEASRAMYNFAQALSAGYVKLIDWKSIENANMATVEFKDELIKTAVELGTVTKSADGMYNTLSGNAFNATRNFNDVLQDQWMTTDVLVKTLGRYADETTNIGKKAFGAAQDVTKVTQVFDILKETAQSGWAQTWEIIFGDINQAKALLTPITNFLSGIIDKMSDARNAFLGRSLNSNFEKITQQLNKAGISTDTFQNKLKELAKSHNVDLDELIEKEGSFEKALLSAFSSGKLDKSIIKDAIKSFTGELTGATKTAGDMASQMEKYGKIVDQVIRGNFGNGADRIKRLTEAGYDYATIQNLVNEKLGSSVKVLSSLGKEQLANADSLAKMSDEQLKSKGYTEEQITALRDLSKAADDSDSSISDLINSIDKPSGKALIIDSLANAFDPLIKTMGAFRDAWKETFKPVSDEKIYSIIEAIHSFTEKLVMNDEAVDKLTRTFKGLFAIVDIVSSIFGGALKTGIKLINKVLGAFNLDLLDVTASIGDLIVQFHDWLFENSFIAKGFDKLVSGIAIAVTAVKKWIDAFLELPKVKEFVEDFKQIVNAITFDKLISGFSSAYETIKGFIDTISNIPGVKKFFDVGKNIVQGLVNGIKDGAGGIFDAMLDLGIKVLNTIKDFLGIHSPSTEMHDVGTNIIDGLVNGIKDGLSKIKEVIMNIVDRIKETFTNIDWKNIFAIGVAAASLGIVKKLVDGFQALTAPFEGVGNVLNSFSDVLKDSSKNIKKVIGNVAKVIKNFSKILGAVAMDIKADAIKKIAVSIGILAASIWVLSTIDPEKLISSILAISLMAGLLVGIVTLTDKMSSSSAKIDKNGLAIDGMKTSLLKLGAAILLIGLTVKLIGSMDPDEAKQGFIGLAGVVVGISLVLLAYGKLVKGKAAQNIDKAGAMIRKLSVALLIMAVAVKLIGNMEWDELAKGAAGMGAFAVFVGLLIAVTKTSGKNIDKVGGMLLKLSVAMLLMVAIVKLIAKMEWSELGKGAIGMLAFAGFVALLVQITKTAGRDAPKIGGLLLAMSASMLILAGVIKIIATMEWDELAKGAVGIAAFAAIIYGLILVVKKAGPQAPKIAATLVAMSIAIALMAGVAVILGLIDTKNLAKGIAAVGMLGLVVSMMIKATRGVSDCKGNLIVMTVAIGIMAAAVAGLSMIDTAKLAGATLSLSLLMGMFALVIKASGSATGAMGPLIVMTLAIGMLAGVLYLVAQLPIEQSLGASLALSGLILAMSAALKLISNAGVIAPTSVIAIGLMALVFGALGGILYLLKDLNPEQAMGMAASLSLLLLALSASILIISQSKAINPIALAAIGVMTLVVAGLGGILYLLKDMNPEQAIGMAAALSVLLATMSAALIILTGIGVFGPAVFVGIGALAAMIAGIGGLIVGIGALVTKFPQLEEFLNTGIPILEKIGYAIGSFLGNIIGGFLGGITSGLPEIGADLSMFMVNAQPFITGAKMIDATAMEGVKALAETIIILTAADVLNGIASWFTGGSSLSDFATELVPFGTAMMDFSREISGMDGALVANAATAGKALAEMASTVPNSGGVVGWFMGENDMKTFASNLIPFGKAMKAFAVEVNGINPEAVTNAATAGKSLTELGKTVPNSGGVVGWFMGENDMKSFADNLVPFGKAMKAFAVEVNGINPDTITNATTAGKALMAMADTVPNTGGLVGFFTGDNDLETFGKNLISFGANFASYSKKMADVDPDIVTTTTNAAKSIVELQKSLPKEGGWFSNEQTLSDFGSDMASFGEHFATYYSKVSSIDPSKLGGVITQTNRLVDMANGMVDANTNGMANFGTALTKLADAGIDEFVKAFDGGENKLKKAANSMISGLVSSINGGKSKVNSAFTGLSKSAVASIGDKASDFTKAGNTLMMNFIKAITSKKSASEKAVTQVITSALSKIKSKYAEFTNAGKTTMDKLISGVKIKSNTLSTSFTNSLTLAITNIRDKYEGFYDAGKYVVQGLANGISDNAYLAKTAANNMADAVLKSTKKALGIQSPSVVFKKEVGVYIVQGIAEGITKDMSAEEAAKKKADNIVSAFQKEFDKLDTKDKTAELNHELSGATDNGEIERQQKRVNLAKSEYYETLKLFGKDAIETQQSYNKYLEEEIALRAKSLEYLEEESDKLDALDTTAELKKKLYGTTDTEDRNRQQEKVNLAKTKYYDDLKTYGKDAIETQKSYNQYLEEEIELRQRSLAYSEEWIDRHKKAGDLSLIDELSAWKRVQARYSRGSESRMKADEEVLRLENELQNATEDYYQELTQIQEDANRKREDLDQEYADNCKRVNEQLNEDIDAANKEYEDAIKSRADSLYNSWGLFDKANGVKKVSADALTERLEGQTKAFEDWTSDINGLAGRGIDDEFIKELQKMGPSAAGEIKAIAGMSDEQLSKYVELWRSKHELAKDQSTLELEDMRVETQEKIAQMRIDADNELDEYRATWRNQIAILNDETNAKLTALQNDWMQKVVGLKSNSESEFTKMVTNLVTILGNNNKWDEPGSKMIEGVLTGVMEETPNLVAGVESAMGEALAAAQRMAAQIKAAMASANSSSGSGTGISKNKKPIQKKTAVYGVSEFASSAARAVSRSASGEAAPTVSAVRTLGATNSNLTSLTAAISGAQAATIGAFMAAPKVNLDTIQNGVPKSPGSSYSFVQNNYSPKALSRSEIYRNTKNQFSALKGLV